MDWLDRVIEHQEQASRFTFRDNEKHPRVEPNPNSPHFITIIGCIRGVDGWYSAGFDESTKTIVPLEKIG